MKSPDDICNKFADKKININCKKIDDDTILLEGDRVSLEFLGQLIISQANFVKDCGFEIGPNSAGNIFFSKESECGLSIHRVPCDHEKKRNK